MSAAIRIRAAGPQDAATIVAFNLALARESEARDLDPLRLHRGVQHVLGDPGLGRYWLAELDGQVAGQLLITREWSDWRCGEFWWIQSVYVRPELRHRGVYRALHAWVEQQARAAPGVCGLRLYVMRDNARARQVYERLGMHPTEYLVYEVDWA